MLPITPLRTLLLLVVLSACLLQSIEAAQPMSKRGSKHHGKKGSSGGGSRISDSSSSSGDYPQGGCIPYSGSDPTQQGCCDRGPVTYDDPNNKDGPGHFANGDSCNDSGINDPCDPGPCVTFTTCDQCSQYTGPGTLTPYGNMGGTCCDGGAASSGGQQWVLNNDNCGGGTFEGYTDCLC